MGCPRSLQHYFQYQVAIKPFYGLAGRLCLSSLECLGHVSPLRKLTLKESDWETPSLGAWGTGWECVLSSLEAPQITIFKQMRGAERALPVLGIAYGLERLVCSLSHSRLNVTECGLGFSYYNLNCLCVVGSFRAFYILEQALLRIASARVFGVFYPACDMFLNLVWIYNRLTARLS
ncbi:Glycine--tRNA ligase alpha subunit [Candidatus Hodgkinia cicadicola]|nr:Glycine--tRNA ligase alpha subunit [Candidatus Hodgkinia cicadicola]